MLPTLVMGLLACGKPTTGDTPPEPPDSAADADTDADADADSDADSDADADSGFIPADDNVDGFIGAEDGGSDCDDGDASVHPGAEEVCEDGIDQDCIDGDPYCDDPGLLGSSAEVHGTIDSQQAGAAAAAGHDADGDGEDDVLVAGGIRGNGSGYAHVVLGPLSGVFDTTTAWAAIDGSGSAGSAGEAVAWVPDDDADGIARVAVGAPAGASAFVFAQGASGALDPATAAGQYVGLYNGPYDHAFFGWAVDAADFDGDGLSDLAVAEAGRTSTHPDSAIHLFAGPLDGAHTTADADSWTAEAVGDTVGYGLVHADFDGDGQVDLAIGAPHDSSSGAQFCAVYVLLGPITTGGTLADADARLLGPDPSEGVGYSLAVANDPDGDGTPDLITGAVGTNGFAGAAYLASGALRGTVNLAGATAILEGETAGDWAGNSVAGPGDMNGDGTDNVAVGSWFNRSRGAAYVVYGPVSGTVDLLTADAKLSGNVGDALGFGLASVGDVDADGLDDLLVGAPGVNDAGFDRGVLFQVLGSSL